MVAGPLFSTSANAAEPKKAKKKVAATDKLNIAAVGIGGRGAADINAMESQNIVALCDCDWKYAAHEFERFPNAKRFKDYREMFDKIGNEFDAVIVGTADHTHACIAAQALAMGKHVYCEKPLTHTVYETRLLTNLAKANGLATQMGNQGASLNSTRQIIEAIQSGVIGEVRKVDAFTDRPIWPQGLETPAKADPIPDTLDWDIFIGPAKYRDFNSIYHPWNWRGWWDFGTGALGDIGCHFYAPIFRACGLTGHYPKTVHAVSTRVNEETFPLGSVVEWQFDSYDGKPPLKMVWYDGGLRPFRPDIVPEGVAMAENGRLIIGDEGMILDSTIFDEKRRKEVGDIPKTLERSPGHYQEFVIACKDPKTPARMNFDQAAPLAEVVLMGNVALRMGLREDLTRIRLHWDQEQFKFTNSKEATEYVHKQYRDGWKIDGCEL